MLSTINCVFILCHSMYKSDCAVRYCVYRGCVSVGGWFVLPTTVASCIDDVLNLYYLLFVFLNQAVFMP